MVSLKKAVIFVFNSVEKCEPGKTMVMFGSQNVGHYYKGSWAGRDLLQLLM
jgi:hypothetical protein